MKVVFINPPVTKQERYGTLAPAGSYSPPLGLCSLAAVARKMGFESKIIDSQVEELDRQGTLERVDSFSPQIVGITSTTSTFLSAGELARMIKDNNRDRLIVVGGVHISALPEESLLQFPAIDLAVIGEGEETIAELLTVLKEKGKDLNRLKTIPGIAFRNGDHVVVTSPRSLLKDLDHLPLPAWDLLSNFPMAYSIQAQSVANFPSTSVCTSRGCTGKCTFCDRRIFGSRLRAHSADYVISLIKDLYYNYGIRDIQFEDDNFMLFKGRLLEICNKIKEEKLEISWSCQARVDIVNLETLKQMKEAGCWMILYGVESGSQKVLDLMQKGISTEKIEKAIDLTHQAGISCKGFFIAGFLNEDQKTLKETYELIKKTRLDDISFHYYTPFPGSAAYEMVNQYGTLKGNLNDMTYYRPVFIPHGLTENDLTRHTTACYRTFYLKPRILFNYLKRIRSFSHFIYFAKSSFALFKYILMKKE